jgi:CDP-diacylglycerol--glycerol-3-phosphate 3-phosphatidyltransferase
MFHEVGVAVHVPWNPANLLSFGRLVTTVPLVILILLATHWSFLASAALFTLMAISDTVDGQLARRYGWVSNFGIFLDLTADKVYTAATLVAMVAVGVLAPWIAIMIIVREFVVTGLRAFAAAEGMVIPADRWGKHKMLLTIIAIVWLLVWAGFGLAPDTLPPLIDPNGGLARFFGLGWWLMLGAVLLTIYSGYDYLRKAAPLFRV